MIKLLCNLIDLNLAVGAAVLLVLLLRLPARTLFGARIAYGLWALPPLAALAMLAPARVVTLNIPAPIAAITHPPALAEAAAREQGGEVVLALALAWVAGMAVAAFALVRRQARFGQAMRHGSAGPAVVGVLKPRVVTPDDFGDRYTAREQLVVLAHENTHIARHDSRANALAAAARCVNWFNPMVHLLAHYLRVDQELACDAQVVAAHPGARRSYAEAMLKTQLAAQPLPLGCYWPSPARHPLTQRIRLLSRREPGPARRLAGLLALSLFAGAWAPAVWLARPAHVVTVEAPAPAPAVIAAPVQRAANEASARPTPDNARPTRASEPAPELTPPPALLPAREAITPPPQPVVDSQPLLEPRPIRVHRIRAAAQRSAVQPGSAVRVMARMVDPDGIPLVTDLTAFGSQDAYRSGYFERNGSRHVLFTSVEQRGDRLWVTASTDRRFAPSATAGMLLASGQTGTIALPNGQAVTVTPLLRAETPDEAAAGIRATRNDRTRYLERL